MNKNIENLRDYLDDIITMTLANSAFDCLGSNGG